LGLPLAPRKSLAGFLAAFVTGTVIVFSFWSLFAPAIGGADPIWEWTRGVSGSGVDSSSLGQSVRALLRESGFKGLHTGGMVGLAVVSVLSGLVTGIAEALGAFFFFFWRQAVTESWLFLESSDLGKLDDNMTLPIISGGCIWGFLKLFSWFSS